MLIPDKVAGVVWFVVRTDYKGRFKDIEASRGAEKPWLGDGDRCFGPYKLQINVPPGVIMEIQKAFDGPPVEADARLMEATTAAITGRV